MRKVEPLSRSILLIVGSRSDRLLKGSQCRTLWGRIEIRRSARDRSVGSQCDKIPSTPEWPEASFTFGWCTLTSKAEHVSKGTALEAIQIHPDPPVELLATC